MNPMHHTTMWSDLVDWDYDSAHTIMRQVWDEGGKTCINASRVYILGKDQVPEDIVADILDMVFEGNLLQASYLSSDYQEYSTLLLRMLLRYSSPCISKHYLFNRKFLTCLRFLKSRGLMEELERCIDIIDVDFSVCHQSNISYLAIEVIRHEKLDDLQFLRDIFKRKRVESDTSLRVMRLVFSYIGKEWFTGRMMVLRTLLELDLRYDDFRWVKNNVQNLCIEDRFISKADSGYTVLHDACASFFVDAKELLLNKAIGRTLMYERDSLGRTPFETTN